MPRPILRIGELYAKLRGLCKATLQLLELFFLLVPPLLICLAGANWEGEPQLWAAMLGQSR